MRYALLIGALSAALAASPAVAGNGPGQEKKAPVFAGVPTTSLVSGPTRVAAADIPGGAALASGSAEGGAAVKGVATTSCGACILTCWSAVTRSGSADWSGHAWIFQYLYWCGNGAVVTYAQASQSYEQDGWYYINGAYGPWWSGGCTGCSNVRASGYILWDWRTPIISVHTTGTSWLNSTMWAYGGVTF
jgi:hypothetical protein